MKKIGLLSLALLLALGVVGGGLAYFSDTASLSATFTAGSWQGSIRGFLVCGVNPQLKVEPRWDWWESPGVEEHSFIVTKVRPGCGHPDLGEGDHGYPLLLLYLVRDEGNVPLKIESVDIDTPDWIGIVRYGCHVPDELRDKALSTIKTSSDIPMDAKQTMIDSMRTGRQQECILEPGPESQPNTWGLICIWLHIAPDAPENTLGTVTVSPVFKVWHGD